MQGPERNASRWWVGEGVWGDVVGEGAGRSRLATRGVSDAERGRRWGCCDPVEAVGHGRWICGGPGRGSGPLHEASRSSRSHWRP